MAEAQPIHVVINGREESLAPGLTLASWLADQGRDPRTVAIERNGEIVPRAEFGAVEISAGDRLELVQFVQGG